MKQTGLFHNDFLIASDLSEIELADADMICSCPITEAKKELSGSTIERRSNSNVQLLFSTHVQGLPVLGGSCLLPAGPQFNGYGFFRRCRFVLG
jgi:hypothetical protein